MAAADIGGVKDIIRHAAHAPGLARLPFGFSQVGAHDGWTARAGLEYAFWQKNVSMKGARTINVTAPSIIPHSAILPSTFTANYGGAVDIKFVRACWKRISLSTRANCGAGTEVTF